MKTYYWPVLLLALGSLFCDGCTNSRPEPVPEADKSTEQIIENLKTALDGVVEFGEGGSGLDSIRSDFELLKEADAKKAELIQEDVQSLIATDSSEERKSLARSILDKL